MAERTITRGDGIVIWLNSGYPAPTPFYVDLIERAANIASKRFATEEEAECFMQEAAR